MLRDEDNGVPLAFIRTERPGGKSHPFFKTQRPAKIIQASHKATVTEQHPFNEKISEDGFYVDIGGKHRTPSFLVSEFFTL